MNSLFKKIATGTVALALTTTVFASSAFAADTSTTITGTETVNITEISATALQNITLNGSTQTVTASLNGFDITDARGKGDGWKVLVSATAFHNSVEGSTLSSGSLDLAAPTVEKADDGASETDTITTAGGAIDTGTPVKVLSAALEGGMGSYNVASSDMTLTLLPKEVYEGTYNSTITVELTSGP